MPAEIWQAMHIDEVGQEVHEITRGDVVLKDGALYIVEAVRDGGIKAIREDGVEVVANMTEFTLLQGDELFQVLEAKARMKEEKQSMMAQALNIQKENKRNTAAPAEQPLPTFKGGWYHLDECGGYEIAPGLKVTGLQILKAKYESPLKAFINIRLNGILTLYGFRILKQGKRASLLPPQRQGEMRYLDIVEIEELPRKRLEALVLKLTQRLAII
ncbi:MAG TPA: hypothetical protein GX506_03295 [Firmicutes bacterium]|nr:hypothetical protein [Bacillota bacterium]